MRQGAFDLPIEPRFGRADFLVSDSNRAALELIERWPDWPARALVLYGPPGSGKTHLAHIWCKVSGAPLISGATLARPETLPNIVAVDDADSAADRALLHLYNLCLENNGNLLLTMKSPPAARQIRLADLSSRLRALPVVGISLPDDQLLAAVLVKLFGDRGVRVAPRTISYLVQRIERSFFVSDLIVDRLDRLSLENNRAVTVPLAREVLAEGSPATLGSRAELEFRDGVSRSVERLRTLLNTRHEETHGLMGHNQSTETLSPDDTDVLAELHNVVETLQTELSKLTPSVAEVVVQTEKTKGIGERIATAIAHKLDLATDELAKELGKRAVQLPFWVAAYEAVQQVLGTVGHWLHVVGIG